MPHAADLVIANGTVVTETATFTASIAVRDGLIAAIGADADMPPAAERIDAAGLHVLPGVIDVHVHFREPGMTHKEDWETGSRAAAMGGVTTVFEMPNTNPPVHDVETFTLKHDLAAAKSCVDFGIYGVLAETNLADLAPLAEAGVIGFKLFLGNTTGNLPCPSDGAVLEGFEILSRLGLRCSIHAENSPILFWREDRLKAAGRNTAADHLLARTDVVALEALSKSCLFAEWTGARIHIVHESCARSLPYISFYKERGVDVTVETLPQYLLLALEDMDGPAGNVMRMNPPIRERWQQGPLTEAFASGLIDMIATDHAPHTPEEKQGASIWDIACGFPGVETQLPLMLTLASEGAFSLERYVQASSAAPARAWGLHGTKGCITPGADADLVLVDLARTETLSAARLQSRGKVSPFEGMKVKGWPVATLVRGKPVMRDGEILGEKGWGRAVRPAMPAPAPRNVDTQLATLCGASPAQAPAR
ncbi:dihydroorotase family protein [Acuticoccus sp. I52.16.1]|uniref:dihydroorotase n=1 Tax=Acuticoccus sp. I52.16.1 TaxID=2928472 RepID=UPI001FD15C4E|nr:dihydroorotase family protein [Acuticoccus sp. I52.16.1]UOM33940.1 dihydroorotase family protein [Acuticoccus sp. I52.16.1]